MTEAPSTLAAALATLQTRLPAIRKSETAKVETAKGSYSYTYADLSGISQQILPILGELGLSFSGRPTLVDGKFVLAYELLHVSGECRTGEYPLSGSTPQAIGSAITYARRYVLCAITGLSPDDDDDAAAAEAERGQRPASAQRAGAQRTARPAADRPASDRATAQRATARPAAGPPPLPGEDGDGISPAQSKMLHALLNQTGRGDREAGLAFIGEQLQREVTTTRDLTRSDASKVIDALMASDEAAVPGGEA